MNAFDYHAPATVEEACALLGRHGEDARVLAGGTALAIALKEGLLSLGHVVSLERLPLRQVAWHDDGLHVGAMVTLQELMEHESVGARLPALREVLSQVASRRIRNVATLGGNLCWAEPATDPPGILTVLGADVEAASARGTRRVPVRDLFVDYFTTALEPDEILTGVRIPPPPPRAGIAYLKFTPQSKADKPVLGVTALVRPTDVRTVAELRVVVGAASPVPLALPAADAAMRGAGPDDDAALRRLAGEYMQAAKPPSDGRGSEGYKREMIGVLIRRAVREAWRRSG